MTIPFRNIPANVRVPLFYAEVSASQANTGGTGQRALIIGQITGSGVATPNLPIQCGGPQDAVTQGGPGSMLALEAAAYLANDPFGEVWLLPLADAGGAVAAGGAVDFGTVAPTAAGTVSFYIAGQLVTLAVTASEATTAIATAMAAAINALTNLPVTAAVDGSIAHKVDITAKNAGLTGNDIDLRLNYRGVAAGETTPAGLVITLTAMASGATNPTLTTGLANLASKAFDFICSPYTDATSLAAITTFLNDTAGRWSYAQQLYGHCFAASRGSSSTLTTLGGTINDQHTSIMGFNDSPTPAWVWAAALTGAAAVSLRADPAQPLQTVPLLGVLAPPVQSRFTFAQQNGLLFGGIAIFNVQDDGSVLVGRLITTYQKNAGGQADSSYLSVETLFTLMAVLRQLSTLVTSKYGRMKLADDGTRFAPGSAIVTPGVVRADLIATYQKMEFDGLVQNSQAFAQGLVVQRHSGDPNRLDVLFDAILIDQLNVFALLAQFRLA